VIDPGSVASNALRYVSERLDELLADLERFVRLETPSDDKASLDAFAAALAGEAAAWGAESHVVEEPEHGNHVLLSWTGDDEPPVLLLGHYDTVWPVGTLARLPFRREGGRILGPGTLDMKGGLVQGLWAVRAYRKLGGRRPITFLVNSDEEIGSPSSRGLIEDAARRSTCALVLEPALPGGALKTARRGLARYQLRVRGRASHSGLAPGEGISAVEEVCRLALELKALEDAEAETEVNVGVISGGSRYNVVAADAECDVGIRMVTSAEAARIQGAISTLRPLHPDATLTVTGGLLWPPMERGAKIAELATSAKRIAHELGFALGEGRSGGSSDACHCAAVGAAVLDGLGPLGGGAHADDEHILVDSLAPRTALVAGLLASVGRTP
jgi:glutamate carboxypeptidase